MKSARLLVLGLAGATAIASANDPRSSTAVQETARIARGPERSDDCTVTGLVTDESGRPVASAAVRGAAFRDRHAPGSHVGADARTDEAGRFRFSVPARSGNVLPQAEQEGFARAHADRWLSTESAGERDAGTIVLRPEALLRLRFVDADGGPVTGVRVTILGAACPSTACRGLAELDDSVWHDVSATSDATGSAAIHGLSEGRAAVRWDPSDRSRAAGERRVELRADTPASITIEVPRAARVSGVVHDEQGRPMARSAARVRLIEPGGRELRSELQQHGRFAFDRLAVGASVRVVLDVRADVESRWNASIANGTLLRGLIRETKSRDETRVDPEIDADPAPWLVADERAGVPTGTDSLELHVDPGRLGAEVVIRAFDAVTGAAIEPRNPLLRAHDEDGRPRRPPMSIARTRQSPAGGRSFRLGRLPPDRYSVVAAAPGYAPAASALFANDGSARSFDVDLSFEPGARIEGHVDVPSGARLSRARVLAIPAIRDPLDRGPSVRTVYLGSGSRFRFDDLEAGTWTLRVESNLAMRIETTVSLARGEQRTDVTIPVEARDR